MNLYTIGHSNGSFEELLALLREHGIRRVVDVRTVPGSRRNPQFKQDEFVAALAREGITYSHIPALGGFRKAQPDSINAGWRNESFRGFADYMQTPDFQAALAELLDVAAKEPTAIMCAEAIPWRCHRSLVAAAVVARGLQVGHIVSKKPAAAHSLTPFAQIVEDRVTYSAEKTAELEPS